MDFMFIFYQIVALAGLYFCFPRQVTNAAYHLIPKWRRDYVVVHFRKMATKIPLTYFIIPNKKTGYGKIQGGQYELSSENSLPDNPIFKKRLHFIVDEGNPIPTKASLRELNEKDVMYIYKGKLFFKSAIEVTEESLIKDRVKTWAQKLDRVFISISNDMLFAEKKQWFVILGAIAIVISLIVAVYAILEVQHVKPMVDLIYQNTIVGNETLVIRGK